MIKNNTLYFYLMNNQYYNDFQNYREFQDDKNRGHGVMLIDIKHKIVAIPLRSKLKPWQIGEKHIFPYQTYTDIDGKTYLKGLDFSKLIFIEERHIKKNTNYIFKDNNEKNFYIQNFSRIQFKLKNYINKYINLCNLIENNKMLTREQIKPYMYTTLVNFHNELGINIDSLRFINQIDRYS